MSTWRPNYFEFFVGTAAVAVAGLLAALRLTKSRMSDHTIVFQGAGEVSVTFLVAENFREKHNVFINGQFLI